MRKTIFNRSENALCRCRTDLEKGLVLSCLFSIALVLFRVVYTKQLLFVWLIWNLALAFLPYLFTRTAICNLTWVESNLRFGLLFTVWLLFLPNSFYIVTDLFHLEDRKVVPLWFDLALIFSFAWNGILLGIASVRQMVALLLCKYPWLKEWQFVYPMMLLNALGIYIGRYLRYNSWDVIADPFGITNDLLYLFLHPVRNRFDWSMILCYTVLMSLVYTAVKRMNSAVW